jgi:hypothetical protein
MEYVDHDGSGNIRINDYDIPSWQEEPYVNVWGVQNQKGPAYVTAKHGIHPETSQEEWTFW